MGCSPYFYGRRNNSEYFDDKPIERLLGEGLESSYINDDSLGRCLDALYDKGVSQLYQQIAAKVTGHLGLSCEIINKDSSSFHYDGKGNSYINITRKNKAR